MDYFVSDQFQPLAGLGREEERDLNPFNPWESVIVVYIGIYR